MADAVKLNAHPTREYRELTDVSLESITGLNGWKGEKFFLNRFQLF